MNFNGCTFYANLRAVSGVDLVLDPDPKLCLQARDYEYEYDYYYEYVMNNETKRLDDLMHKQGRI